MKLSELAINVDNQENGAWVDNIPELEGLRLKVRGSNNSDWRKMQQRLLASVPRKKRVGGNLDPKEVDRITSLLLLHTGLLDWDGLQRDDDQPLPYSKTDAEKLLTDPQYQKFRDGILWACNVVADGETEEREEDVKN